MANEPDQTRYGAEATVGQTNDTVEALTYGADAAVRTGSANEYSGVAHDTLTGVADIADAGRPDVANLRESRVAVNGGQGILQENSLVLALGSIAAGFLLGSLLPVSAVERKQIGPIGEKIADGAKAAANDLVDQGKVAVMQAVSEAFSIRSRKSGRSS